MVDSDINCTRVVTFCGDRLIWQCVLLFVVMFAYEQCLLCLGHHPDVWIEAAAYVEQASKLLSEKGVSLGRV